MKRGTPEHPKTWTLAAVLDVPRWGAVGILESLWHFAQKYAPAGDVGRHTDESIARAIGWDGNAGTLVSGLVQCGWLDRCVCHRVRVHDWPTHADQTTRRHTEFRLLSCYQEVVTLLANDSSELANASGKLAAMPCRAVPSLAGAEAVPPAVSVDPRPDFRAEDSIRKARWTEERELLAAVQRISEKTGRDAPEVMREVTAYKRDDGAVVGGKTNPALLRSAERVSKSLEDARAWLTDLESDAAQETRS